MSPTAYSDEDEDEALELADEAEEQPAVAAPFDLSGMQESDGYANEYDDDVDGIVDPLAGLRSDEDEGLGFESPTAAPAVSGEDDDALELGDEYAPYTNAADEPDAQDGPVQDDLLANADRLAAEDRPVEAKLGGNRRRSLLGGAEGDGGDAGAASNAGSTLFERMANLSRSTARDDDDDGDDDGPALSIPRFLGRQNNQ
jgi:cell division protein FtsZ